MSSVMSKRVGVLLVGVVAPVLHFVVPGAFWIRTSSAVAGGLLLLFFTQERADDERVRALKLEALSAAFSIAFSLTLVVNWLLNRHWTTAGGPDGAPMPWQSISALDLIILTMVVALAVFHYRRRQDDEPVDAATRRRA